MYEFKFFQSLFIKYGGTDMKLSERFIKDDQGVAIIIAMFTLVILTLIGIAATRTSNLEQQIASYDANYKRMFYNADAGIQWALAMLELDHVEQATNPDNPEPCYPDACTSINPRPQEYGDDHKFTNVPADMPFDLYLFRIVNGCTDESQPCRVEVMSIASETTAGRGTVEATVTAAMDLAMADYAGALEEQEGDELTYQ